MEGQPHHIVKGPLNRIYTDTPYPFLYAIGSGFVQWMKMPDVVVYLRVGKLSKGDLGHGTECAYFPAMHAYTHSGNNLMSTSRQQMQHVSCVRFG